jgi:hypothetical protein
MNDNSTRFTAELYGVYILVKRSTVVFLKSCTLKSLMAGAVLLLWGLYVRGGETAQYQGDRHYLARRRPGHQQ